MPKQAENFMNWMEKHEKKTEARIKMLAQAMVGIFAKAREMLENKDIREKILEAQGKLFEAKTGLADDFMGVIEKIGTKTAAIPGVGEVTGPVLELMAAASSIGFVLYKYKQKKLAAYNTISYYEGILKSHVYVDLLKRYLENNKTRYASVKESELLENVIGDFAEEVAVLFYIQHACLIKALTDNDYEKLVLFFVEGIEYCAEEAPNSLYANQHAFKSYKNEPVEAVLNVMYNTDQVFGNDLIRDDLIGNDANKYHYDIKYYFNFADRLTLDLSAPANPKISCESFINKVPQEIVPSGHTHILRRNYFIKKDAEIELYPAMTLFNPVEGMHNFEVKVKLDSRQENIQLAIRNIAVYLASQSLALIEEINEKLKKLREEANDFNRVITSMQLPGSSISSLVLVNGKFEDLEKQINSLTKTISTAFNQPCLADVVSWQPKVMDIKKDVTLFEKNLKQEISTQKELIIRKTALYEDDPECKSDGEDTLDPAMLEAKGKSLSKKHVRACYLTAMYDDKSKRLFAKANAKRTDEDMVKIKKKLGIA